MCNLTSVGARALSICGAISSLLSSVWRTKTRESRKSREPRKYTLGTEDEYNSILPGYSKILSVGREIRKIKEQWGEIPIVVPCQTTNMGLLNVFLRNQINTQQQ